MLDLRNVDGYDPSNVQPVLQRLPEGIIGPQTSENHHFKIMKFTIKNVFKKDNFKLDFINHKYLWRATLFNCLE